MMAPMLLRQNMNSADSFMATPGSIPVTTSHPFQVCHLPDLPPHKGGLNTGPLREVDPLDLYPHPWIVRRSGSGLATQVFHPRGTFPPKPQLIPVSQILSTRTYEYLHF